MDDKFKTNEQVRCLEALLRVAQARDADTYRDAIRTVAGSTEFEFAFASIGLTATKVFDQTPGRVQLLLRAALADPKGPMEELCGDPETQVRARFARALLVRNAAHRAAAPKAHRELTGARAACLLVCGRAVVRQIEQTIAAATHVDGRFGKLAERP